MSDEPKNRGGRPRKHFGRVRTLAFRVPEDLYEMISGAASNRGWTLSDEITARMMRSFRDDDVRNLLIEALGFYRPQPGQAVIARGEDILSMRDRLLSVEIQN